MEKELAFPQFVPLNIGYWEHHADWNFDDISSPFFRIYLVMEGEAKVIMNHRWYKLTPGHLYIIPPFTIHTDRCDGDFSLYYIHIFETMNERRYSLFEHFSFPFEIDSLPLDKILIDRLMAINEDRKLTYSDPKRYDNQRTLIQIISENGKADYSHFIETRGILLQLFSRFLPYASLISQTSDAGIVAAKKYIREHINETIKISTLADICCQSEDHFIRIFKKEMGNTPLEYIQQKKIEKAQTMLIFDNYSVKDVAYTLSYTNQSYFIRLFKKLTGLTPAEYKNRTITPKQL